MSISPAAGRSATIHDVAARAGVAASTVSRALSNPGRVNFRTRERVEQAAAELNYIPSSQARALTSGRTVAVALLVPDITNPFYFDIIRGTQMQLKAAGYTQLLVDTEESAEVEAEAIEKLRKSADGVILTASRLTDDELSRAAATFPLVAINRGVRDVPSVVIDTPSGIGQALDHLVSLGHRRVAYISGPAGSWSNARRWQALQRHASDLGLDVVKIGNFPPKMTSGAAAADAAVNQAVTACVAFNDLIAIGMLQRLAERGIQVPDQMSIVGCDDIFGAEFCNPPLTTLTAPIEQAGRVAITMLLGRLNPTGGTAPRQLSTLPTHLTVRASTGPAPSRADPNADAPTDPASTGTAPTRSAP
ncbi:MAG TPA: LacI family DNA-binding transcriptional regulator [Humibacter sp.]|nr:LacI family DNA-binding transcriptional regulator [Humibacter sp.]